MRRLTNGAFAGIGLFAVLVLTLHVLEPDFDPASRFVSEYVLGDSGRLMNAAFFALGAAIGCCAWGLRRTLAPGRGVTASTTLLGFVAVTTVLSGVFNSDPLVDGGVEDPTVAGIIHDLLGFVGFIAAVVAVFMLRGVFRRDPLWATRSQSTGRFAVVNLMSMVVVVASPSEVVGITQRAFLVVLLAGLAALTWWIRKMERHTTA